MPESPAKPFSGIFVSYRRDDSSGHAGRLYDKLVTHFGKDRIFMDIDTIDPGEDFVTLIENAVGSCEILIAVIGRQWLSSADDSASRRLDNPHDFVRLEIATALSRDIRVIPVLVQRANMPKTQDLPDDLAKFSRRNAIELSDLRWQHDVDQLIAVMERVLAKREEAARIDEAARQAKAERQRREEEEKRRVDDARQAEQEHQRFAEEEANHRVAEGRRQKEKEEKIRKLIEEERIREEAQQHAIERELERRRVEAEQDVRPRHLEEDERARASRQRQRQTAEEAEQERAVPHALGSSLEEKQTGPDPSSIPSMFVNTEGIIARGHGGKRKMFIAIIAGIVGIVFLALILVRQQSGVESQSPNPSATPSSSQQTGDTKSLSPVAVNNAPLGMVYVTGGEFMMGRNDGDEAERPAHPVTVKPFFIDTFEVTNEDYEKFVKATNHRTPATWKNGSLPSGAARKPVTGVTWADANDYAHWAGKLLPTEEEWEFAARGTDGRIYPWGNDWQSGLANANGAEQSMADVGAYRGASPFGVVDMVGNAWEWTASQMAPYMGESLSANRSDSVKVIRGGTYLSNSTQATTTYRRGYRANCEGGCGNTGFRCVKDVAR
jgi:formylglycine-generating enzyme required for sulfatase activity